MEVFRSERRSAERFPLRMDLRCRPLYKEQRAPSESPGSVVDISKTGILFGSGLSHQQGECVELSIDWPVLYEKAFPIRLAVVGSIVRSDDRGTAIRILRHEFEPWRDEPMLAELLSLLYTRRRISPHSPGISLLDLELPLGIPRGYLQFATRYLKNKQYVTCADNSELRLTALGMDYVESNYPTTPGLQKQPASGSEVRDRESG